MAMAVLGVLSGMGALVSGGFAMRSSYLEWEELNENPDTNTWDRTWTIFKGFLGLAQMGTGAACIGSVAYEMKCQSDARLIGKIEQTRKPLGEEFEKDLEEFSRQHPEIPTDYFTIFDDPRVRALVNKHSGIEDPERLVEITRHLYANIEVFQNMNKTLAAFQGFQLIGNVFREVREPDLNLDFRFRVTHAVLQNGIATYISLARSHCDSNLNINFYEDCIAKGASILLSSGENISKLMDVKKGNGERVIKGVTYIPYKIPASIDKHKFQYVPIPEKYADIAPFCENICPINYEPIARALFIIQNSFPHICDKKSLVEYAIFQRKAGNSLKNPHTNLACCYADVYECPEWDYNCDLAVRRLQEEEIENLKQQNGAK